MFSPKMILPKYSKIDPFAGLVRIFGLQALIQLGKAIAKFLVVGAILMVSIMNNLNELTNISQLDLGQALQVSGDIIIGFLFLVEFGLGADCLSGCAFAALPNQ